MKTLLFCTTYTSSQSDWNNKYLHWLQHNSSIGILFDKILMVDDGSSILPDNNSLLNSIILSNNISCTDEYNTNIIYHFPNRLGRIGIHNYHGWYRSFGYAIKYAKKYNYEKIIHIESDAYIISQSLVQYINIIENDWIALWTPKWRIAETAIQIIAGKNHIDNCFNIFDKPYSTYANKAADTHLEKDSWLNYKIIKNFIGDRWGEDLSDIPYNADYACQINTQHYLMNNKAWFLKNIVSDH